MHVCVTGSSGMMGSALIPSLSERGHRVTRLVRREPAEGCLRWNPDEGKLDTAVFADVDAVVHLAGESIAAGRWTASRKARIRDSRVNSTRLLCETMAEAGQPPRVLVNASAIGYYGDRGEEPLTEQSPAGEGFLPDLCRAWESATQPAIDAGIRVVCLRFGVVLSAAGGALKQMLLPFRLGAGGRVGSGTQYWSWIAIDDAMGAIVHALKTESLQGPVNAVAPNPVTNRQFTKTLGRVLRRPTVVPLPAFAARLVLGQMAVGLLLASAKVAPIRLQETGFEFRLPELETALRSLLSDAG